MDKKMNHQTYALQLFNSIVLTSQQAITSEPLIDNAVYGFITDFAPKREQLQAMKTVCMPLNGRSLFTVEERKNDSIGELLLKQILHYHETYGGYGEGYFDLKCGSRENVARLNYVKGITVAELAVKVRSLLTANAPIANDDIPKIKELMEYYAIEMDVNDIVNNEARIALFDRVKDTFTSGDDVVRYIIHTLLGNTLLIKDKTTIRGIKTICQGGSFFSHIPLRFMLRHEAALARVFNRHKPLILALKGDQEMNKIVNRIGRKSKRLHVPVRESIQKTFIAKALADKEFKMREVLKKVSLRDKFKFLNLLEWKYVGSSVDIFKIRNGKMHVAENRKVYKKADIDRVKAGILKSIKKDLKFLKGKKILLDPEVDYGLPISRKQVLGRLPHGTQVTSTKKEISSGMYWENEWGSRDLDLSAIDDNGRRVGWGHSSGYDSGYIVYSGDVTNASTGAFEFMTSKKAKYALFTNIFSGEVGSEMEIVVGEKTKHDDRWMDNCILREKIKITERQMVFGLVKGKTFTVWSGTLGNSRVSRGGKNPQVDRCMADMWTITRLLDEINIPFDVYNKKEKSYRYDYNLSYSSFSYDKLENVLGLAA